METGYLLDASELTQKQRSSLLEDSELDLDPQFLSGHQTSGHKPIRVAIYDRSASNGKYLSLVKQKALRKAIFDIMYQELLSDSDFSPRFNWSDVVDGVYRCIAVDEASAAFLRDRVERMPPLWPGARLQVVYKAAPLTKVEAYVPGVLIPTENLFDVIRQFDRMIQTSKWQYQNVRPHNQGHVYTFAIDSDSYKWLDQCNGFIPYFDSGIEFRVLKD